MLTKAQAGGQAAAAVILRQCEEFLQTGDAAPLLTDELKDAMAESQLRPDLTRSQLFPFVADRPRARTGAWYEMVPRSQGKIPGQHGTFKDCIARLPDIAAMGFRRGLSHADPPDRPHQPQGPQQRGDGRRRRSRKPLRDRRRPKAATMRCIRNWARWRISASSSRPASELEMEVALDFAVQCSPDHPWLKQHPQWFRRRPDGSMRYAENPPKKYEDIVNPDFASRGCRRAVECAARRGAVLDRTGREDFPGRQSPHQAVPVLGMADPRSSASPPRRDLPRRSLYPAETDEGPRQARLHPILHLFHLADAEVGAGAISDRTDGLSGARLLSPEFLRQYAGYPALSSAERRGLDVQIPRRAGRHAVRAPTASTTDSSCWNTSRSRAARNISIPKNTRSRCGTGTSRAISSPISAISTAPAGENTALQQTSQSALPSDRRRQRHRLRQGIGRSDQQRRRRDRAVARACTNSGCRSATSRSAWPAIAATSPRSRT